MERLRCRLENRRRLLLVTSTVMPQSDHAVRCVWQRHFPNTRRGSRRSACAEQCTILTFQTVAIKLEEGEVDRALQRLQTLWVGEKY